MFVTYSGTGTGCASGTAPGHIGICVCPGDGCQTDVCALTPPDANRTQRAKSKGLVIIFTSLIYPATAGSLEYGKTTVPGGPRHYQIGADVLTRLKNSNRSCDVLFRTVFVNHWVRKLEQVPKNAVAQNGGAD